MTDITLDQEPRLGAGWQSATGHLALVVPLEGPGSSRKVSEYLNSSHPMCRGPPDPAVPGQAGRARPWARLAVTVG